MIEKRKIFILLDSNPYDCALTKTELEKKEDITLTDEDYAARLKDSKNFPQDPEAPLSTYFIRSPLSLNYEGEVAEGGDQDGYDGLGLGGYFLTYHAKGVPQLRPLDYEQVNAYEGIKAHLTLCYQKNGSFPSSMQFQMINVGEAYPYKYAFRLDGLGVDLRGAKSIIEQISMWVNAHPASYFPTAGILPTATRPRNPGALPVLPIEANTSTQESRSGKDESKDG